MRCEGEGWRVREKIGDLSGAVVTRWDPGTKKTRLDRGSTDVVQKADLDFPVALDRLRYLALTMSSLSVLP